MPSSISSNISFRPRSRAGSVRSGEARRVLRNLSQVPLTSNQQRVGCLDNAERFWPHLAQRALGAPPVRGKGNLFPPNPLVEITRTFFRPEVSGRRERHHAAVVAAGRRRASGRGGGVAPGTRGRSVNQVQGRHDGCGFRAKAGARPRGRLAHGRGTQITCRWTNKRGMELTFAKATHPLESVAKSASLSFSAAAPTFSSR